MDEKIDSRVLGYAKQLSPIIKKAFKDKAMYSDATIFVGAFWVIGTKCSIEQKKLYPEIFVKPYEQPELIKVMDVINNTFLVKQNPKKISSLIKKYSKKAFSKNVPEGFEDIQEFVRGKLKGSFKQKKTTKKIMKKNRRYKQKSVKQTKIIRIN